MIVTQKPGRRAYLTNARQLVIIGGRCEIDVRAARCGGTSLLARGAETDLAHLRLVADDKLGAILEVDQPEGAAVDQPEGGALGLDLAWAAGCRLVLRNVVAAIQVHRAVRRTSMALEGASRVRVEHLADASVVVAGRSELELGDVSGARLDVEVAEHGRVRATGHVRRLDACVSGYGNLCFGGSAQVARLSSDGPASISVVRVSSKLTRICSGSGTIAVVYPPHD